MTPYFENILSEAFSEYRKQYKFQHALLLIIGYVGAVLTEFLHVFSYTVVTLVETSRYFSRNFKSRSNN